MLNKYIFLTSNTNIRQDGKIYSYCGLRLADIPAAGAGTSSASKYAHTRVGRRPKGVPIVYHNLGPPSHQCFMCNATMWYNERSEKSKKAVTPSFSLCCQDDFKDLSQPNLNLLTNLDNRLLREALSFDANKSKILPVFPNAKRPEVIQGCINQSELWKYCKVFTLTRSMRVNEFSCNGEIDNRKQDFNRWIVAEMYPDFTLRKGDDEYLTERAILTPTNDDADAINENMFKKLGGPPVTHNSADEICKASTDNANQHDLYPVEFLN
nr:hypothetical protein [Tanacetum cinerariifolium]